MNVYSYRLAWHGKQFFVFQQRKLDKAGDAFTPPGSVSLARRNPSGRILVF